MRMEVMDILWLVYWDPPQPASPGSRSDVAISNLCSSIWPAIASVKNEHISDLTEILISSPLLQTLN